MKRLFYFTGHRFIVYHWKGKECIGRYSFDPVPNGHEQFHHYLKNSDNVPVRLLIDIIEEDFRKVTIPHVYGADRKAVVNRLMDRYYRKSRPYVYQEKVGRVKKGRRDDELLMCAITNTQLIRPWLDMMEEHKVPLSGIWSLPLLSHNLLPMMHAKHVSVLLVSQQVNSTLRQSFFQNGKLVLSRQSVINMDAADISRLGELASSELKQTLNFLRNQRHVPFNETIHVHFITSEEQIEGIKSHIPSDADTEYHFHLVSELLDKLHTEGLPDKFADGIFAWKCMTASPLSGHYGGSGDFFRYYQQLASMGMIAASILIMVTSLVFAQGFISKAAQKEDEIIKFNAQAEDYTLKYRAELEALEPRLVKSLLMKSTVSVVERVNTNRRVTPAAFYVELSRVLSQRGLGAIRISHIDWKIERGKLKSNSEDDRYGSAVVKSGKLNLITSQPLNHVAEVRGSIPLSDDIVRLSVEQINKFIDALKNSENIISVEAVKLPIDVRSDRRFDSTIDLGADTGDSTAKKRKGDFILKLVMKGVNHES